MTSEVSPAAARTARERLDSWKQIASYLQRDVRTVQRWEKSEGLPIQRHQHGSRGTVFAYPDEIDVWLEGRTSGQEPESAGQPVPVQESSPGASARRPAWVAPFFVLLVLVGVALWQFGGAGEAAPTGAARVLVLPFSAVASDPLEETTGRALHEQLITDLAGLAPERLAVIGRTSALRYGATGLGLAEIGDALGVDHVLEGAIRRQEGALQVTARLVRATGQSVIWSGDFTLDVTDLAQDEDRMVREVCAAVADRVLEQQAPATSAGTDDPAARAAWLRGRYLWHKGTPEGFLASLPHFEEALEHDPDFVDAHVGLANAYNLLGRYGQLPAHEVFPKSREAATRALLLDPDSAEAHAAMALVHFYYEWDFEAAARAFHTSLQRGPGLALTHHAYAHFLSCLGLHELGLAHAQRARELEPLWPLVIVDTAWFHFRARDYEQAVAESRRALQLEPGMPGAVTCLVESLQQLGDPEAAWVEMRAYLDGRGLLAKIPGLAGEDPAGSLRAVRLWKRAEIERMAQQTFLSAHAQVFSLAGLGRDDELLTWLATALETRDRVALLTRVHPAFDSLRDDPRFQAVVDAVGFPSDPEALIAP